MTPKKTFGDISKAVAWNKEQWSEWLSPESLQGAEALDLADNMSIAYHDQFDLNLPEEDREAKLSPPTSEYAYQEKALARNSDPSTSHQAAESLDSGVLDTHRRMILDCLEEGNALTGDEIEATLGWPNCRATRRLPELFRMGLVRPEGRAKTRSGRWARLWHLN